MKIKTLSSIFLICGILLLAAVILWPGIDLGVSGWFYEPGKGFIFAQSFVPLFLEGVAYYGSRALGIALLTAALATHFRRRPLWKLDAKSWLFLLLGLLLAPGLIGNLFLKDHWGRARPREITEFGGTQAFSPALVPQPEAHKNGSFVSGDAAFGFYLPSFGYIVPRRSSRRFFWGGMGVGCLFGLARIIMGAHFLSDVLFAALFMLMTTAMLHAAMYNSTATKRCWKDWFFRK